MRLYDCMVCCCLLCRIKICDVDGQSERLIQVLEDMLRVCVMEFTGSWDRYIPLMEFSYNNNYQSSIDMTPYEALYGRRCKTPICWIKLNEHKVIGPDIVKDT